MGFCVPHKNKGWLKQATKKAGPFELCDDCALGVPVPARTPEVPVKEQPLAASATVSTIVDTTKEKAARTVSVTVGKVANVTTAVDWAAVDRDDAAGMKATEIAKKYGLDEQAIYNRRYGRRKKKELAPKPAAAKVAAKPNGTRPKPAAAPRVPGPRATTYPTGVSISASDGISLPLDDSLVNLIWEKLSADERRALIRQVRLA